jgi:low temperature requirement protein LtrA
MALYAFGYAHLLMLAGVVLTAAGVKLLIEQLHEATLLATSTMLVGGIALYLLGDMVFRRIIHVSSSRLRMSIALLSLLTIPPGICAGGLIQVGALLVLLVLALIWERAVSGRPNKQSARLQ